VSGRPECCGIIIDLKREKSMEQNTQLLKDYSGQEKASYLEAIAAIATADRIASEEELEFLDELAESAGLDESYRQRIRGTASEMFTETALQKDLDVLKKSDLRFSLLTDLIAFAESDKNYSEPEKQMIEKVAGYLGINQQQYSTINHFVHKASEQNNKEVMNEQVATEPQGFLQSLGLENQFKNAGINFGSISKGLLGMLAPFLLGRMTSGRSSGRSGGLLGGLMGGSGGGLNTGRGGGLGSIISMLSGGRGMGNIGGMLGRMFGRR
jgi:uncharacterized tellurite resistance protein B-like protein